METRYMVDTASQELPIEEKTFLKFAVSSALFFFSNDANGTSITLPIFLQTCVFLTVWEVFFFQTVVGSMWSGLLLTFVIGTYQIAIFNKYVGGHLPLAYKLLL